MRLNRFDPSSINVRGGGGGGFPGGAGGGIGCGTLVIALVAALVFGVDPTSMLGGVQDAGPSATQQGDGSAQSVEQLCTSNAYATESCNALQSLNQTWEPEFKRAGIAFQQPTLVFYSGGTRSGCGNASSAMGPFYCPQDEGIYIDTSFYDQMERQLGARGDFARYYVAHEYGHHIQKLTGVADAIRSAQSQNPQAANQLQVRMELQADCYAGVWAGKNRNLVEPGDFAEGMTASSTIGDDALTGGQVSAENFTHGTSAQRMEALRAGLESGNDTVCDRYVQVS